MSVTFLTQLIAFVDASYEKLLASSQFSVEQAWALTMKVLDRICEDLFAPKEGVVVAMNVEEPSSICAHVLRSGFRTHDVMASYIDTNFEDHQSISAEYMKFLAMNSGSEKVDKLEGIVASLKTMVEAASKEAGKARSIADRAASAAVAHKGILADLGKRVGRVEK